MDIENIEAQISAAAKQVLYEISCKRDFIITELELEEIIKNTPSRSRVVDQYYINMLKLEIEKQGLASKDKKGLQTYWELTETGLEVVKKYRTILDSFRPRRELGTLLEIANPKLPPIHRPARGNSS